MVGLTGTPEQIAAMAKAYKVYYAKTGGRGADYLMDHASAIYLMDPKGRFDRLVRSPGRRRRRSTSRCGKGMASTG